MQFFDAKMEKLVSSKKLTLKSYKENISVLENS